MNKSESIKSLAVALVKFQMEVTNPHNTATNPFFKSKYAPLNDILTLVRPLLAKQGLAILQSISSTGDSTSVSTMLLHESGEYIESDIISLKPDKNTPQGSGAAATYARRYSLSALLNIASEDDDDANSISGSTTKPTPVPIKTTAQQRFITNTQAKELTDLGLKAGVTEVQINAQLKRDYDQITVYTLDETQYQEVKNKLLNKIKAVK